MIDTLKFAFLAVAASVPVLVFWTGAFDPYMVKEAAAQAAIIIAACAWLVHKYESRSRMRLDAASVFFLAYAVVCACSALVAAQPGLALNAALWQLLMVLLYLMARELVPSELHLVRVVIFCAAALAVAYGAAQMVGLDPVDWQEKFSGRLFSSFGNPNFFAGFLLLVFPLLFIEMNSTRSFGSHVALGVLGFALVINLALTKTRGAWIGFLAAFCLLLLLQAAWTLQRFANERMLFRGSFWAGLFFASVFLVTLGRVSSPTTAGSGLSLDAVRSSSVQERLFKWRTAWEIVRDHPWLGVGAGNLKVNFALYQARVRAKGHDVYLKGSSESNVHNEFLQVWAETGSIGLLVFVAGFAAFLFQALRGLAICAWEDPPERYLRVAALMSAIIGMLIFCGTNFPLRVPPNACIAFIFMGMAGSLLESPIRAMPARQSWGLRWFAVAAAAAVILLWVLPPVRGQRFARAGMLEAETAARAGQAASSAQDPFERSAAHAAQVQHMENAAALLEQAVRLDPLDSERIAYELGMIYVRMGDNDSALRAFERSTALRNYSEVYNNAGNCWFQKGAIAAAEQLGMRDARGGMPPITQKIIRRMPDDMYRQAMDNWKKALELRLPDVQQQQNLAEMLRQIEKWRGDENQKR